MIGRAARSRSGSRTAARDPRTVTVGVDVDDAALTVARRRTGRGPRGSDDDRRADEGVHALPHGAVVDGIVRDLDVVAGVLRDAGGGRRGVRLRIGLTTPRAWTAVLAVDPPARWTTTLPRQVADRVPLAAEDAHVVVNLLAPSRLDTPGRRRALVVAMRREDLAGLATALAAVGARQPFVTLSTLAIARRVDAEPGGAGAVVIIDRRRTVTSVAVVRGRSLAGVLQHTTADLPVAPLARAVVRLLASSEEDADPGPTDARAPVDVAVLAPPPERAVLLRALEEHDVPVRDRAGATRGPGASPAGLIAARALAHAVRA